MCVVSHVGEAKMVMPSFDQSGEMPNGDFVGGKLAAWLLAWLIVELIDLVREWWK